MPIAYVNTGIILNGQGHASLAEGAFREAIRCSNHMCSHHPPVWLRNACLPISLSEIVDEDVYLGLCISLKSQARLKEARQTCDKAVAVNPQSALTYHHFGNLLLMMTHEQYGVAGSAGQSMLQVANSLDPHFAVTGTRSSLHLRPITCSKR